jgi:hypothetical protein
LGVIPVVVPFSNLHPVTKAVLDSYKLPVCYVPLEDDDAYRRLLQRLWHEGQSVILIEQDIVCWPGALEELAGCSCVWGSYTYRMHGGLGIHHMFGATKITSHLMEATAGVWDEPGRWDVLDQRLWFAARDRFEPHPHRPPVIHLSARELAA